MAKPIFIVELPNTMLPESIKKNKFKLEDKLTDYHVLVITSSKEEISFQCFHEKDIKKTTLEGIKEALGLTELIQK